TASSPVVSARSGSAPGSSDRVPALSQVGPYDGENARLSIADDGRITVDDLDEGRAGAGWVEAAPRVGGTALVRVSTAALGDAAAAEVIGAITEQADAVRVVLDTDDGARAPAGVTAVPPLRV